MDILSLSEQLAGIDRHLATFHSEECLNATRRLAKCELCHAICPKEAIKPGYPLPEFNQSDCVKCKACLPICPVGAYKAEDSVLPLLKCITRFHPQSLELICEKHPAPEAGIPNTEIAFQIRGCLAGLGSGAYLALFALGVEHVIARTDACGNCEWGKLYPRIESQIQETRTFLSAWEWDEKLSSISMPPDNDNPKRPIWNTEKVPVSRRDLFRLPSQQSEFTLARELAADLEDTHYHPSRNRARLIASIRKLIEAQPPHMEPLLDNLGFVTLSVDESCTACGSCARICPTGALIFESDKKEKTYHLKFAPELCIDCKVCLHACMPHSLTLDSKPSFEYVFGNAKPITIREGQLTRCEGCKVWFASEAGEDYCPGCAYRRKNMFGSLVPRDWQPNKIGPYPSKKEVKDKVSE